MMKRNITMFLLIFLVSAMLESCHQAVGCPADQYNDWKKIAANRKQQLKSPNNIKRTKGPNVVGNGVVPR